MTFLGIDTSAVVCSAAIVKDGTVICEKTRSDGLTHSETLLPMIRDLLKSVSLTLADLSGVSISCGPGSFTGLRIGISTVKGLTVSGDIPCAAVSTLEALSYNARDYEGALVCPVMDARRGEFYHALFRIENGLPSRLTEDGALSGDEIAARISGESRVLILGDGAEKFVSMFPRFESFLAPFEIRKQSGVSVALVGARLAAEGKIVSCDALAPSYLRLPQAEREWNKRHENADDKKG